MYSSAPAGDQRANDVSERAPGEATTTNDACVLAGTYSVTRIPAMAGTSVVAGTYSVTRIPAVAGTSVMAGAM